MKSQEIALIFRDIAQMLGLKGTNGLLFSAGRLCFVVLSVTCCLLSVSCTKAPLYKNKFIMAGTYLEVISPSKDAAAIVHKEFKRLSKIFNAYDDSSQISRLNNSPNSTLEVSPEMIEILQISKDIYDLTDGAFDISCGELYNFWKDIIHEPGDKVLPDPQLITDLKGSCGMECISINSEDLTVRIKKEGLRIDLGGIAKGYMVDKSIKLLKENGINSAIINAGGDLYCLGNNNHKRWRIGVRDPNAAKKIIKEQDLFNQAIATSGDYEQFFELDSRIFSHIIDPRGGYPADKGIISVSVISQKCTYADAYATAFYLMGVEKTKDFLSREKPNIKVFIVETNQNNYLTL